MDIASVPHVRLDLQLTVPEMEIEELSDSCNSPLETVPLQSTCNNPPFSSQYETIATLPLHNGAYTQATQLARITQPTQLIERSPSERMRSPPAPVVQVAASSPLATPIRRGGFLASAMAPAGTSFRRPYGVTHSKPASRPAVVSLDSDDEGPTYMGGSSDSDTSNLRKNDIKTSVFARKPTTGSTEKVEESPHAKVGSSAFQEITANAFYRPIANGTPGISNSRATSEGSWSSTGQKRSADTMANACGTTSKKLKPALQTGPSRAAPVIVNDDSDMELDDISDPNMRAKTRRLRAVLTSRSIRTCFRALQKHNGNYEDATNWLVEQSEKKPASRLNTIDLTGSEDELMPTPAVKSGPRFSDVRQQAKKPGRSILEKWSSTQNTKKPLPLSLPVMAAHSLPPAKKGRKLVRGRRDPSSPSTLSASQKKQADDSESEGADFGVRSASEDKTFDGRLLTFFNTCSPADLTDTASISLDIATHLISKRPFKTLNAVSTVEAPTLKPTKAKRKPTALGERIVEKCDQMLRSYEAVDYLVQKCKNIATPLANEMNGWGVNVFGTKDGELDMVSLKEPQRSQHDSGIGTPVSDPDDDRIVASKKSSSSRYISQPSIMKEGVQMKDYQVVGLNWLSLLFQKNLSCILADDMGLGKTCQVIAFLAYLYETGEKGPHLVVVPAATLENWLKEFQKFCPTLIVEPYYASNPPERLAIQSRIDQNRDSINAVVTTYTIAKGKEDWPWLKHFGFCATIYDEGHYLKNADSQLFRKLVRIKSRFRLLLTGTPLQNNLKELISLLGFLMPNLFGEKADELQSIFTHNVKAMDSNHEALLSAQRIARARSMLTPFILRRKKYQVLKELPQKTRRVEYCDLTPEQSELYAAQVEKATSIAARRAAGENVVNESANVLMRLRQAAIHPFLFRRLYTDENLPLIAKQCLKDDMWVNSNPDLIVTELQAYSDMEIHKLCSDHSVLRKFALRDDEWLASGKIHKMLQLLRQFISEGHRTLIFSQFVMVLDILELVLEREAITYFRLDGNTKVSERQDLIDEFCDVDNQTPVFMLSTKAGGAGINLAKANKVIVFDSGFNPQDDIQAENRAHRIGQEKEVEVVRLVCQGTVEEQIYKMGLTKLKLDEQVAGDGDEPGVKESEEKESEGRKLVEEMFFEKLAQNEDDEGSQHSEEKQKSVQLPARPRPRRKVSRNAV